MIRTPWQDTFSSFEGPIGYEVWHLGVSVSGELGFGHSLNRMSGKALLGLEPPATGAARR